jgi:hypothetical protein
MSETNFHDCRGHLTVTMVPPTAMAQADTDVAALSNPQCSQVIRANVESLYLYQLRLRVAQDPSLAEHITVLYTDKDGRQWEIDLGENGPLNWPPGFEMEPLEIEHAIIRGWRAHKEAKSA